MNDNELLILAAKAAGYVLTEDPTYSVSGHLLVSVSGACGEWFWWNPRTDDGDALRLAVKAKLNIQHHKDEGYVVVWHGRRHGLLERYNDSNDEAATRLAIVRAAAEIGKAMP